MSIKKENTRITITLTKDQKELLEAIKEIKKCKTYGKAINYIFEAYYIGLDNFIAEINRKK